MKKLAYLLSVLAFVLAGGVASAQITKEQSVAEWQRAKNYTKAYLDAMPADGYTFKATPEVRSFAQQMLHLADANYFFVSTASSKESPLGKTSLAKTVAETKEATTKAVIDSYDYAISTIQAMPVDKMQETVTMMNMKVTRALLLAKGFEHQTHHRGQCTVYLRLKGVTPPQEMLF